MAFWVFMFLCDLLTPALMMAAGRLSWKYPPKDINGVLGYRTKRSMKNQEMWDFAQAHSGRLWWYVGSVMLVPSALVMILFLNAGEDKVSAVGIIVMTVQMVVLIVSIFPTEMALKKSFDEEGKRKA